MLFERVSSGFGILVVSILRSVLVYKAWSYPDYRDEIPEEERSVGTDELDLPSLGLQRERA